MLHLLLAANLLALSRCNDQRVGEIQAELQHASRLADVVAAQSDISQERTILRAVCPDADFAPLDARLFALDAWGDLLARAEGTSPVAACPDKQKVVDAAIAAGAYHKLVFASTVAPQPAALVPKLLPQVQALAAQSGVTLPSYADATSYWAGQYQDAAAQAIGACRQQHA
jgi:hypothetical protein